MDGNCFEVASGGFDVRSMVSGLMADGGVVCGCCLGWSSISDCFLEEGFSSLVYFFGSSPPSGGLSTGLVSLEGFSGSVVGLLGSFCPELASGDLGEW